MNKGGDMKFYTIKEVADMLRVHERTIHNWILSGKLEVIKIKKTIRISEEQLNKLIEE